MIIILVRVRDGSDRARITGLGAVKVSNIENLHSVRSDNPSIEATESAPTGVLLRILSDTTMGGAILVGSVGSGRRTVIHEAISGLNDEPEIVQLYGSPFVENAPRGVLAYFLTRVTVDADAERHDYVRILADSLIEQEKRVIVVLGNPVHIDRESAIILAQLAAMRRITLIVLCTHLSEVPQELLGLFRSGQLAEVLLTSMTVRQARAYLESFLEAPMSLYAAATIRRLAQASRSLMRLLATEFVAQGKLVKIEGCWVLGPAEFEMPASIRIRDAYTLSHLSEDELRILMLLSLAGPIPSHELARLGLGPALDSLRDHGFVSVNEFRGGQVRVTVPVLGQLVRDRLEKDEVEELAPALHSLFLDPRATLMLADFESLVERGNYVTASEVMKVFEDSGGFSAEGWKLDPDTRAHMATRRAHVLFDMRDPAEAFDSLMRARQGLAEARETTPINGLLAAEQQLAITEARLLLLMGRADRVTLTETGWLTEILHFRGLVALAEARAIMGHYDEALMLVSQVREGMEQVARSGVPGQAAHPRDLVEIEMGILGVLLHSGEWAQATAIAARIASGKFQFPTLIARTDLTLSVLRALSNPADMSVEDLQTALSQFDVATATPSLRAVQALVAYASDHAPHEATREHTVTALPQSRGDFMSWAGAVFVCKRDPETAGRMAMALAKKSVEAGNLVLAMSSLALALRFGRVEAADDLAELASKVNAPISRGFALIAGGVIDGDSAEIAEGLHILSTAGHGLYALGEASSLTELLDLRDRRRILHDGRQSSAETATGEGTGEEPSWLGQLTKREAEISRQVIAGMTNKAIARQSGISVRTVEGHLYQVYSKLHVRNRQELVVLYRAGQTQS